MAIGVAAAETVPACGGAAPVVGAVCGGVAANGVLGVLGMLGL